MARGPFHFKTFTVEQDGAAMKVGTDGIVLGCWTNVKGAQRVMDAGAGNGYVGIMLMQRMERGGKVIGCELEPQAATQAAENYATQPFSGLSAEAWQGAMQDVHKAMPEIAGQIDLVVSNPPFFRNKPKSPIEARNLARHDDTLTMGDIVKSAAALLKPKGRLCTIWPHDRVEEWHAWSTGYHFSPSRLVHVKTMRHLAPKRFLSEWIYHSPEDTVLQEETLTLEGEATLDYTEQYLKMVRPYLRGT